MESRTSNESDDDSDFILFDEEESQIEGIQVRTRSQTLDEAQSNIRDNENEETDDEEEKVETQGDI